MGSNGMIYRTFDRKYNIHELACICFIGMQVVLIFGGQCNNLFVSVMNKTVQIASAIVGLYGFSKVYNHKIFKKLLWFDAAYFVTCLVNPNLLGNLKVFVHFLILQGLFFYVVYRRDAKALQMVKKYIVVVSTILAVLNNLFIIFPIGISGYVIGYIHGKNFGFFPQGSTSIGALYALSCIIIAYDGTNKKRKMNGLIIFVVNYIALISNATRAAYIMVAIGIGAVQAFKAVKSTKHKYTMRGFVILCTVTFTVGTVTLCAGKLQDKVYFAFGSVFREPIKQIAYEACQLLSQKQRDYLIINGGTNEILFARESIKSNANSNQGDFVLQKRSITDLASMGGRNQLWKEALLGWRHNRLLGVGRMNLGLYAQAEGATVLPEDGASHNAWLNILCWSGVIGVFLFGRFVIDVMKCGKRNFENKKLSVVIVLGLSVYMLANPGMIYGSDALSLIFWSCLGDICGDDKSNMDIDCAGVLSL